MRRLPIAPEKWTECALTRTPLSQNKPKFLLLSGLRIVLFRQLVIDLL